MPALRHIAVAESLEVIFEFHEVLIPAFLCVVLGLLRRRGLRGVRPVHAPFESEIIERRAFLGPVKRRAVNALDERDRLATAVV